MIEVDILANSVVRNLKNNNLRITIVESCTGGGLVNCITNIIGASEVITTARIVYSTNEKIRLGIPKSLIEKHSVYSREIAIEMAKKGVLDAIDANISVGITGSLSRIDEKNPGSEIGVVYIAVIATNEINSDKFIFDSSLKRWEVKDRVIIEALKMIINVIES